MGFVHSVTGMNVTHSDSGENIQAVPLACSSTQGVCLPEPPLLVAQQGMQMGGSGVLGPFLVRVMVRQPLQDRKDTV